MNELPEEINLNESRPVSPVPVSPVPVLIREPLPEAPAEVMDLTFSNV